MRGPAVCRRTEYNWSREFETPAPNPASRRSEPFDSEDYLYELKIDGFRALAHLEDGLFEEIVKMDLDGMVCKRKDSPYHVTEKPSPYWIKVKNRRYSQAEGREELFERS
jgi:ATP-dependent DNA ligase